MLARFSGLGKYVCPTYFPSPLDYLGPMGPITQRAASSATKNISTAASGRLGRQWPENRNPCESGQNAKWEGESVSDCIPLPLRLRRLHGIHRCTAASVAMGHPADMNMGRERLFK